MSGYPRIGAVDVNGPIGRGSRSMVLKDIGLVEPEYRSRMAMTVTIAGVHGSREVGKRIPYGETIGGDECRRNGNGGVCGI